MIFWLVTLPMLAWVGSLLGSLPPREALWRVWWVAALFVPNFLYYQISAFSLTERFVCVAPVLLMVLVSPGKAGFGYLRPVPADLAALLLVLANLVSEYNVGRFKPMVLPDLLRLWLFPYVVGRVFFATGEDLHKSIPIFAKIGSAAAIYAVIEGLIKINLINKALGKTFGLLESGEGYRMGLKRSQGAQDHPIFMGLVLLMMLPWAFEASRLARRAEGPRWWKTVPWLVGAALFTTVSRGPQLSALVTTYLAIFFRNPKKRILLVMLAVLIGLAAYSAQAAILAISAQISKEADEPVKIIEINGEEEEYTGTRHRMLLFKAYSEYLETAGLWGFGQAMSKVQLEERIALRFSSIDSTWVMLFLQRGYAGVSAFILLTVISFMNALWVAWPARRPHAPFCGAMVGALLMMVFGLFTSWFSPDYGAVYLFTTGICARLPYLQFQEPSGTSLSASSAASEPARRPNMLIPGHPPLRPYELIP
ncbi:MAG: hypothetical protein SFX72_08800 [Isosphaeraceae bacterium]|nr:hypothetical protein [Isosphaeraceae bacterium]